jgi:hypothetical protein
MSRLSKDALQLTALLETALSLPRTCSGQIPDPPKAELSVPAPSIPVPLSHGYKKNMKTHHGHPHTVLE